MGEEMERARAHVVAEIGARIDGYLGQLTVGRDLKAVADVYTEDVRLMGPDTDLDRSGVLEGVRSIFEGGLDVEVDRRTIELYVHGDSAYEIAQTEDTFVNPDGTSDTIRNNLFIRWEEGTDGKWRFARVLSSPRSQLSS